MKVLPVGSDVAGAIAPSALARLVPQVRDDLRMTLTVIKFAETMADLMGCRGTRLSRLGVSETADYHYGTAVAGVLLRPVDDRGSRLAVPYSKTGLSTVYSVAILAVGPSLKEATTS